MKIKENKGISLITLIIIVVVLIAVILGIVLIVNQKSKSNMENGQKTEISDNNDKYIIYINNYKIILGKTKINDIIDNVGLNVIDDKTYYENEESKEMKQKILNTTGNAGTLETEQSKRIVKLSDGTNTIIIKGFSDTIKSLSTLANGNIDDPDFDFSTKTKITFVDNKFGKNISMGDYFTEDEYNNCYEITGTAYTGGKAIYVSQTERFAHDQFGYYLDNNYRIVNMWVDLDYLNF